jgi:Protein of unknown function (DUF1583) C domain
MRAPTEYPLSHIGLCLLWAALTCPAAAAEEYGQSFRGRGFDLHLFRATGSNAHQAMSIDPRGLRIALRADHSNNLPVGLILRSGVRGDFEITMGFNVIRVDKPTAGNGAGVSIWISTTSAAREAATIARLVRPNGESVFAAHRAFTLPDGKREYHGGAPAAAEGLSGQLRLMRKGNVLTYLAAQGENSVFQELYQTQFTTEDLDTVRFAVDNGGSPTVVDARIEAANVRAGEFGSARVAPVRAPWSPRLIAGLTVAPLLLASACWLWRRYKRNKCSVTSRT